MYLKQRIFLLLKKPREIYNSWARREDIYVINIIRLFNQSLKYNFKLVFLEYSIKQLILISAPLSFLGAGLIYSIKFN